MEENLTQSQINQDKITTDVFNRVDPDSTRNNDFNNEEKKSFLGFLSPQKRLISFLLGLIIMVFLSYFATKFFLNKKSAAPNVILSYWGVWEDPAVMSDIIADFERQYPTIKINYEKQDIKSLGQYINRLKTREENNTAPDIFRFHNSWLPEVKNLLLPLPQDVVTKSGISKNYYPVIQNDLSLNGAFYGIPLGIDTLVLLVNQELLQKAGIAESGYPKTWDDLVKIARSLTVKTTDGAIQTAGVALGTFDNIAHASDILSLLFAQNGADFYDLKGKNRKNAEDALYFYTSFANSEAKVWDASLDASQLAFAKGRVAMIFAYSWDILEIKALNPNFNIKVLSVPSLPGRSQNIASYWAEGVSLKTKHSKEAFLFLSFISEKRTLEKFYQSQSKTRLFGQAYPRLDMADLLKDNPYLAPIVFAAQSAVSTPFSSDTYDDALNASLISYLGDAVRGVVSDNISAPSAIDTLGDGVKQAFSTYAK